MVGFFFKKKKNSREEDRFPSIVFPNPFPLFFEKLFRKGFEKCCFLVKKRVVKELCIRKR